MKMIGCFGCTSHTESAHLTYEKLQVPPRDLHKQQMHVVWAPEEKSAATVLPPRKNGPPRPNWLQPVLFLCCFDLKSRRLHTSPSFSQHIANSPWLPKTVFGWEHHRDIVRRHGPSCFPQLRRARWCWHIQSFQNLKPSIWSHWQNDGGMGNSQCLEDAPFESHGPKVLVDWS